VKIGSVEIKNFRCLLHVEVKLDSVTTLIGPNGAGKSSILRALDWFFNGDKSSLSENDVYHGAPLKERKIEVKVVFSDLTDIDRRTLGAKYAPVAVETFTAWRTWEAGEDKFTGKAMAFPPF
jgi:putative ATP-dependent endonuclease of OLD family